MYRIQSSQISPKTDGCMFDSLCSDGPMAVAVAVTLLLLVEGLSVMIMVMVPVGVGDGSGACGGMMVVWS